MKPAYTALHLFCGLGGCALGFQNAGFETLLGVDNDAAAVADFKMITGAPALCADLSTMSPDELRDACGGRRPDMVFSSSPCKSFSPCLPKVMSVNEKYTDMSSLAIRGIWLALEAWSTLPPPMFILENVPRIQSRGGNWLAQIEGLLRGYGYAVRGSTHDCGEVGGLAQHRRRYLMVARHTQQVPEVLYEPTKKRVRGCGEVLETLPVPVPGSKAGGPMHRLKKMSDLNWLRIAVIPKGKDWRALPACVAIAHRDARLNGGFGVLDFDAPAHTVVGAASPHVTWASVADPRLDSEPRRGMLGVIGAEQPSWTVLGHASPDNGPFSFADPRLDRPRRYSLGVRGWDQASITVIGHGIPQNGAWQIADPRLDHEPRSVSWGVLGWAQPTHTIRAREVSGNTASTVADPRLLEVIAHGDQTPLDLSKDSKRSGYRVFESPDGTWHRPMTTLELLALQGFPTRNAQGEWMVLTGKNDARWRERIGNAVPPPAAEAIGRQMIRTLDAARSGGLLMGSTPIWVQRLGEMYA